MFKKDNKYTMEEFKKMFEDAEKEVIKDAVENKVIDDPMVNMMMSMVTMKATNDMKNILFGEKENDENED